MLTRDNVDVMWPYSDAPGTSLSSAELLAMLDRDASKRAIAHAHLTRGQVERLYRRTKAINLLGLRRRMLGKRILASGLADYCLGIGETKLMRVFSPNAPQERQERIKALLALS